MTPSLTTKSSADFGRRLRGLGHGLWSGDIDFFTWIEGMIDAIARGYNQAWLEGEAMAGLTPEERTPDEQQQLTDLINDEYLFLMGLGDFIQENAKALGGKYGKVVKRVELWVNRYGSVKSIATSSGRGDRKLRWDLGATEEHCEDCFAYNGTVHRGSVWASVGAHPQSRNLACGGWRCDCRLTPTDERASPGRPHSPTGG